MTTTASYRTSAALCFTPASSNPRMEIGEGGRRQSKEKFLRTFLDFMTKSELRTCSLSSQLHQFYSDFFFQKIYLFVRFSYVPCRYLLHQWFNGRIAEYEELTTIGSVLLCKFRQALAHGTKRLLSYFEAGSLNSHDTIQNASKLRTCHAGLQEHICKAKSILTELKCLVDNDALMLQSIMEEDEDVNPIIGNEEVSWSDPSKPKTVDYVALMAIIYGMVKQDYTMQDRIVSSLTLKSSPGELETYCQMWSLRPFIDDDIMQNAWSLIP